jgi:hypothetical protein
MPAPGKPTHRRAPHHRRAAVAGALGALALLAAPAHAGDDEQTALQDIKRYREVSSHDSWKIYFQKNTLDIWRGNEPYKGMKNGHASFVVTWRAPIAAPSHPESETARSAAISYIFSCSPPYASVFAKVVFFATPFVPKNDSLAEQWRSYRQVVETNADEEQPDAQSWRRIFDRDDMPYWRRAWEKIYKEACSQ